MNKNIRNFCIIAHIDHGKSTLADRLLEVTGTVEKRKMQDQILDLMPLERERGITIKMQPVRMVYHAKTRNSNIETRNKSEIQNSKFQIPDSEFILHLIDTPGHADFGYEVSRALKTVEGAILLVDATQGVQAQTIFNYEKAREAGLTIIPAMNKIDLPNADSDAVRQEIYDLLGHEETVYEVSAKTGEGVEDVLRAVIARVPAPQGDAEKPLKALIFDSTYDPYLGVIAYVRIMEGSVKAGDKIRLIQKATTTDVKETGIFNPKFEKRATLSVGEIGYLATGLKDITRVRVGETVASDPRATPLPGYTEPKPVIFASFYTPQEADFAVLDQSLKKLRLNDPSLYFEEERSQVLGRGFKCGFLGMLHLDIVKERLKREFNVEPIIFSPSVHYRVFLNNGEEKMIYTAEELPDESSIKEIHEPWTRVDILTPFSYMSKIIDLVEHARGKYVNQEQLSPQKTRLTFEMPLDELLGNFYDTLKSVTQGYASLNYEIIDWRPENLVKLEIVVAGEPYEPLSKIIQRGKAVGHGTELVKKLKELLPKQLFAVALQARVGGQIIAREDLSARRKDVTGYLYGGDITRKMKLLEKQKRGKEKMKARGKGSVEIPNEILFKLF